MMKFLILTWAMIFSVCAQAYPLGFKATTLTTKYPALVDLGFLKGTSSGSTVTVTSLGAGVGDSLVLGGTKAASAVLDVQSTTQGVLPPRMTTAQMLAIATPATGLTIYNTDINSLASWNGTTWTYGFGSLNGDTVYSAYATSTGANISLVSQNKTWLASWTYNSAGRYDFTSVAGAFTQLPSCVVATDSSTSNSTIQALTLTSGVLTGYVYTRNDAGLAFNGMSKAYISCQKQGIDYILAQNTSAWVQANSSPIATTTEFTAQSDISAGVSRLNVSGWVASGSIVSSVYTFPITGFTVAPNCWANSSTQGSGSVRIVNVASTSSNVLIEVTGSAGVGATTTISFGCQRSGADYLAAHSPFIIGTFAGTPNVPGYQGKVDTFSVSYGTGNATTVCSASPCSYLDQIGTAVTSITRPGASSYVMTTAKTYSKLKCTISAANTTTGSLTTYSHTFSCASCNSVTWLNGNLTSTFDTYGTLFCMGSY